MNVYIKVIDILYFYLCVIFYLGIVERNWFIFKIFFEEDMILYLLM